jgi:DNA-binding transcriptional LysR family regulator
LQSIMGIPIKIEMLYYFMVIAESQSLSEAAERLFMSQQALSKNIAQLEQALGYVIIHRNTRKENRLTPAGEALRAESYPLLSQIYQLESIFSESRIGQRPQPFRIGAILALEHRIAQLLQTRQAQDPTFQPHLQIPVGGPAEIEIQLLQQELDLAILLAPPASQDLAFAPLQAHPYVIAGHPQLQDNWENLSYLAYVGNQRSQDALLNVWPEERWPRRVIGKADAAMAVEMCLRGHVCLHIPQHFIEGLELAVVADAPFTASYTPYLVWAEPLNPLACTIQSEILELLGA